MTEEPLLPRVVPAEEATLRAMMDAPRATVELSDDQRRQLKAFSARSGMTGFRAFWASVVWLVECCRGLTAELKDAAHSQERES